MHRFFVAPEVVAADWVTLPAEVAHQVRDVLRLRVGERIVLLDNSGREFETELCAVGRDGVQGAVVARRVGTSEPGTELVLYQGLLKATKFEWILQKGTEMGVRAFVPTHCQRSIAGLTEQGSMKVRRWERILQEAAEQCGRTVAPVLFPTTTLETALAAQPAGTLILFPWEEETATTLRATLAARHGPIPPNRIALFIGPEGGFTADEARLAAQQRAHVVTLGPRLLRAETAALATIAMILYEFAELG